MLTFRPATVERESLFLLSRTFPQDSRYILQRLTAEELVRLPERDLVLLASRQRMPYPGEQHEIIRLPRNHGPVAREWTPHGVR